MTHDGLSLELPLLGVPLRYSSNNAAVIEVAERALSRWRRLPPELVASGPPLTITVEVQAAAEGAQPSFRQLMARSHGKRWFAVLGTSLLSGDLARGEALALLDPELASDEATLRREVIERVGLLLATGRDRVPLQATALSIGERAVLLAEGDRPSVAALRGACVAAGFRPLADGTTFVSAAGGVKLWGHASSDDLPPGVLPALWAEPALVCLVERAAGQASAVEPLPPLTLVPHLTGPPGLALLGGGSEAATAAVSAAAGYRLRVGDATSAALLLHHLLETI